MLTRSRLYSTLSTLLHLCHAQALPSASSAEMAIPLPRDGKPAIQSNQIYFPQQPKWFSPTLPSSLREPVNVPTLITQEDAKFLEHYMKNYFDNHNNQQLSLNLATINDRRPTMSSNTSKAALVPTNQHLQPRSDLVAPALNRRDDRFMMKKGKVDDVLHFPPNKYPPSPAKQLTMDRHPLLMKLNDNCITRSQPIASVCEDHLIRRLNQDATEGRTVVDVGRRVCCALFWHKDCINKAVVQTCPDSSPAAADYLFGSRKLDLILSCQNYNRDGCNGATRLALNMSNFALLVLSLLIYIMAISILILR